MLHIDYGTTYTQQLLKTMVFKRVAECFTIPPHTKCILTVDYLKLNSTKRILERVAANEGLLTWYGIVKYVEQLDDIERDPPSYYVLKELTRLKFLRLEPPDGGNSANYWLTETGRAFLSQF